MGKRGRHPAPAHLKILEGRDDYRYINYDEVTPEQYEAGEIPEPPVEMTEAGRVFWDRLVPDLVDKNVMTDWDVDQMVLLCENFAIWHECRALMGSEYTAKGAAGGVIKSPYWQIMKDAQGIITSLASRYGLTPGDRANLTVKAPDDASSTTTSAERLLS